MQDSENNSNSDWLRKAWSVYCLP